MNNDELFNECCKTGNMTKLLEIRKSVTFTSYTKQCMIAMKNNNFLIVKYLFNVSNNNIYVNANNSYLVKKACANNLVKVVKKIICTTNNNVSPKVMMYIAYKNNAFDVFLYLLQLTSIFPEYISDIFQQACISKHMPLINYLQEQYKNFHYEVETEEIITYQSPLINLCNCTQ